MICFAWRGFPQYAARCIGAFVATTDERVVVIATKPSIPIRDMEKQAGCEVVWIGDSERRNLTELVGAMPRILVVGGWSFAPFNRFRDQVRDSGGLVVCTLDNNFIPCARELLKSLRFRLFIRRKYNAFFVPGKSGKRLLKFYGVPSECVFTGLYSADGGLFHDGKPLPERPRRVVFVGQYCDRKNVLSLCEAFIEANHQMGGGWCLETYGCGPLRDQIPRSDSISVNDFLQPEALSDAYRNARVFALPSKEEHWGLVVHEGALSGCVLALSKSVGALEDFNGGRNCVTYDANSLASMVDGLKKAMQMSDGPYAYDAQRESVDLAGRISLAGFADGLRSAISFCEQKSIAMLRAEGRRNGQCLPNFMGWVADAWVREGYAVKRDIRIPHIFRAVLGRLFSKVHMRIRRGQRLIVCTGSRIESVAWPWNMKYEIVPFVWDMWPRYLPHFIAFVKANNVRTVFCTASKTMESLKQEVPSLNVRWIPEGIDSSLYHKGCDLADRPIDILEYGRRMNSVHDKLVDHQWRHQRNHHYSRPGVSFCPDAESLARALADSKIVISYPRSDTNPDQAGEVETLTQRYWEGMLSGALMVGRAPAELVEFCGYNPVVELEGDVGCAVERILDSINEYQALVDRNYDFAVKHAPWHCRMHAIKEALFS